MRLHRPKLPGARQCRVIAGVKASRSVFLAVASGSWTVSGRPRLKEVSGADHSAAVAFGGQEVTLGRHRAPPRSWRGSSRALKINQLASGAGPNERQTALARGLRCRGTPDGRD